MNPFEIVGTLFGLLCVWLTVRENIWCWPASLVNVLCFWVMFFEARLYAELITYAMFFVLSIHGWLEWLHGGPQRSARRIARSPRLELLAVAAGVAVAAPLLGWALATFTDAALPYWDSLITALSFGGQILLNRKRLECWGFWIAVDVIGVGVYVAKGLYLTSGLYLVFLFLACTGLARWSAGRSVVDSTA